MEKVKSSIWTRLRLWTRGPHHGMALVLLSAAVVACGGATYAQEEDADDETEVAEEESQQGDAEVDGEDEVELVVVTGSRIARSPSEQSRNVVVLDEQDIRAAGELTLYRVLRQLPRISIRPTQHSARSSTGARTRPARAP